MKRFYEIEGTKISDNWQRFTMVDICETEILKIRVVSLKIWVFDGVMMLMLQFWLNALTNVTEYLFFPIISQLIQKLQ